MAIRLLIRKKNNKLRKNKDENSERNSRGSSALFIKRLKVQVHRHITTKYKYICIIISYIF